MITIDFSDLAILKNLSKTFQKQVPFAASQALNKLGFDVMRDVKNVILPGQLTLRNKFTQSQFQVEKATKQNLAVEVGFNKKAYWMLKLDEKETRYPHGSRYIPVPTRFARIGGSELRLKRKPLEISKLETKIEGSKYFIENNKRGHKCLYLRKGNKAIPLYNLVPEASYNKRDYFPFEKILTKEALKFKFEENMMQALMRAVK